MKVAVVGTGLVGGSIGLGLSEHHEVVGWDEDARSLEVALERGAVSAAADSARSAVAGADLVIMALPVDRMPRLCWSLEHLVDPAAIVTDVGSAKAQIVKEGEAVFGDRFVGGHPMAGSERRGIESARSDLFEDAWWILTPTDRTSSDAYAQVGETVRSLGAKPVGVDPVAHDALVARLSHLPQIAASAIVEVAAGSGDREALLGLAGAGFRDVTRIAGSDPDMWVAILRSNRAAVLEALDGMGSRLREVGQLIERDRWDELRSFLDGARTARLELWAKPSDGPPEASVGLTLLVPDRPGVLAEVTTAAGHLGVNIEDLRIVHSTEGGRGRLELVVAGAGPADELGKALEGLGYHVEPTAWE